MKKTLLAAAVLAASAGCATQSPAPAKSPAPPPAAKAAEAAPAKAPEKPMTGKQIAFSGAKGNCLACHSMPSVSDAIPAGNIAPPLIAMKARFPDRAALRGQIEDAAKKNPRTMMPPYGRNGILTQAEIDLLVDYIHSL